jgi:hypothetical protein
MVFLYTIHAYDDVYFVTRCVAGSREEILSTSALHRPKYADTASALALLHEKVDFGNLNRLWFQMW